MTTAGGPDASLRIGLNMPVAALCIRRKRSFFFAVNETGNESIARAKATKRCEFSWCRRIVYRSDQNQ